MPTMIGQSRWQAKIDKDMLKRILSGSKCVEVRAGEEWQRVAPGDLLALKPNDAPDLSLLPTVVRWVKQYRSFEEALFDNFGGTQLEAMGFKKGDWRALREALARFYGWEALGGPVTLLGLSINAPAVRASQEAPDITGREMIEEVDRERVVDTLRKRLDVVEARQAVLGPDIVTVGQLSDIISKMIEKDDRDLQ